ncbi:MAG: LLM class flavin-dependent oxidoreductase [Deltaproteobacteria bacterium]|nr:LLM class flavin-dependent oxidoreductase [Deltaproteobacteria bacterium]
MAALGVSFWPFGLSYKAVVELGKRAEDHGFDGVFAVEGGASNDVMATVEAIALATQRVTVGTGIANLYLRHPATLGAGAVAVDELSGGRLILGIGVNNEGMIKALGIAWKEPRTALRETTAWLRQVFAGQTPPGFRTPFRPAQHPIPIHLAGVALETTELAGEIADGLMLYIATKERFKQAVACMEQGARKANRNPREVLVTLLIPTFLSEDLSAARAAARQFLAFYSSVPLYAKMFRRSGFSTEMDGVSQALARGDREGAVACVSDRLMDAVCLVGPVARCKEQLAAFREAGVDYPILGPQAVQEDAISAGRRLIDAFGPR